MPVRLFGRLRGGGVEAGAFLCARGQDGVAPAGGHRARDRRGSVSRCGGARRPALLMPPRPAALTACPRAPDRARAAGQAPRPARRSAAGLVGSPKHRCSRPAHACAKPCRARRGGFLRRACPCPSSRQPPPHRPAASGPFRRLAAHLAATAGHSPANHPECRHAGADRQCARSRQGAPPRARRCARLSGGRHRSGPEPSRATLDEVRAAPGTFLLDTVRLKRGLGHAAAARKPNPPLPAGGEGLSRAVAAGAPACRAYCAPSCLISASSWASSASSRSVSGARTGPASWPTSFAPAFTMLTA